MANDPGRSALSPEERESRVTYDQPGVLVHLQSLRSHLGPGLLSPLPEWARWLLCAAAALVVFVSARPAAILVSAVVAPVIAVGANLAATAGIQTLLPIAS